MDHQRIVAVVRAFVLSSDQRLTEKLNQVASDYAEACREANERLRRCEDYLKRGMRSEAIQFAEAQPVLLDMVEELGFPERSEWDELTATYQLEPAPGLLMNTAQALNRAYSELQPLETLLRRNRLLALSRAPMQERLELVREIATRDAGNPLWGENVALLEAARIRGYPTDFAQAVTRRNVQAVFDLIAEIENAPWSGSCPIEHVEVACREAYKIVGQRLIEAHQKQDEKMGKEWHASWNWLRARRSPARRLLAEVGESLAWLRQLDAREVRRQGFRRSLSALDEALSDGESLGVVEELYVEVRRSGFAVPKDIESRFRARKKALEHAVVQQRREYAILGIVVGIGLIAIALFFIWIGRR